ncbi:MAG: hypothetical protein GXP26_17430, partial [Planctomycetes bacterium]|nr:hypothetical protein [Planctomycetota bacterium]
MRIKSFRILAMAGIVCGGLAMASNARASHEEAAVIMLNPTSDGWVDVNQSSANFDLDAQAEFLNVNQKVGIMMFSLPAVLQTATINNATLTITPAAAPFGNPFVYIAQPGTSWVADEATYNNPFIGASGWDGSGGDIISSIPGGPNSTPGGNMGGGGSQYGTGVNAGLNTITWPLANSRVTDWANGTKVSGAYVYRQFGTSGTQGGSYGTLESTEFAAPVLTVNYTPAHVATGYYVSNSGSDTGPGTLAQPFRTIQKASDIADAGDTVFVRGGTYRETVTVAASGTAASPITFKPYQGERVTITGLDEFNGSWSPDQGNIYQASMAGLPTQMFFNGELVSEARYPAAGQKNPLVADFNNATSGNASSLTDTANITPVNDYWKDYKLTAIPGAQWREYTSNIDSQTGSTLNYSALPQASENDTPFYITGGVKALVSDRQWVHTPSDNKLYFNAPGNVDPTGQNVEVRTRSFGLDIEGDYVNVEGFQFKAAAVRMSGDNNVIDGVQVLYPSPFPNGPGQEIAGIRDQDGINNTVRNSEIAYAWGSGVMLAGATDATIENNIIHDVNWKGFESNAGIVSFFGGGATITGNTIYNTGRSAVSNLVNSSDITFSNNVVSRFGFLTKDLGGFQSNDVDAGDSLISNNVISDERVSNLGGSGDPTIGGIYLDNDTEGYTVQRNVVHDVRFGVILNTPSTDNLVVNNTLWNVTEATSTFGPGGFTNVSVINNLSNEGSFVGSTVSNNLGTGVDPFVNSAAGDFRLMPGSQPIHFGMVVPGLEPGYNGQGPDAGAFQSNETPWTAGANFKTFLFADQESVPLASAVSVKQDDSKITTGDLITGNPTA